MDLFKGQVAFESAQFQSGDFAEELLIEMQRLRDIGDFSQAAMKKCKVSALTKLYTDMDVEFVISDQIRSNAHFILPAMDKNHPFFRQLFSGSAIATPFASSATTLQSIRESSAKTKEAGVDLRTGRVKGYFKQVKVTIVLAHNFFTDKVWKTENLVGIYLHELGHAFTYFEYFGNIVRKSILIDQASKTVMDPAYNSEDKRKLLVEVERQLGTEKLELEKTINLPSKKAKLKVEEVLITDDVFNHTRTESSTPYYDSRNIEQLADQFCVIHGAGVWQAEALSKIYKEYQMTETLTALEHVIIEIMKLTVFLVITFFNPFLVLVYGLSFIPMAKIYDPPKERLITLKRQMIANLKNTGDKLVKRKLVEDIKAVDEMINQLEDHSTIFEYYCNYLHPVGRRQFKEENFRKGIEEALNNDLFLKAAEFEVVK